MFSRLPAKSLPLPTVAVAANRWKEKETPPARNAKQHRFAESTKYPRSKLDWPRGADRVCPLDVSAGAVKGPPTPRVLRSPPSLALPLQRLNNLLSSPLNTLRVA